MKRKFVPARSRDAFRSDEFRAFAIRWLGFDPDDTASLKRCEVYFNCGSAGPRLAEYVLEAAASQRLTEFTVSSDGKTAEGTQTKVLPDGSVADIKATVKIQHSPKAVLDSTKLHCILAVANKLQDGMMFSPEALGKLASRNPDLFYDPDKQALWADVDYLHRANQYA